MSIANFIPTVWSARMQRALRKALVFAQLGVINRDYEGDINEKGDKVKIIMIGDAEIKDYTRNADIDPPQELSDSASELEVDQGKYFNFAVDDVDKRQAQPDFLNQSMERQGYLLRDKADSFVAARMSAGVQAANILGTSGSPKTITSANESYSYLVDLGTLLDEANVPQEGRWAIVPPWYHGLLRKKPEFVSQGTPQSEDRLANGNVGNAAGFEIMKSNNCPSASTTFELICGVGLAVTYADQILKTEAYRPERRFSDAMKGLHVYGAKVVRPEMLAKLYVTRPS